MNDPMQVPKIILLTECQNTENVLSG